MLLKRLFFVILCAFQLASPGVCENSDSLVVYEAEFPNLVHHEANINVTYTRVPVDAPLVVRMSRSSPGYYASFAFAKNIYDEKVHDSSGKELTVTRPDQHRWEITGHDGTVKFTYKLFGNYTDGTHSSINSDFILLNIPSSFVWAEGWENSFILLKVKKPVRDWAVITQLPPTSGRDSFYSPNLAYFIDSPVSIGDFEVSEWEIPFSRNTQKVRVAVNRRGAAGRSAAFCRDIRLAMESERKIFGEYPAFDYGQYSFIVQYSPDAVFDGMEHRNSTILTFPDMLNREYDEKMTLAAHEFFHTWNGERIRPASLSPFDLTKPNMCGELWFLEGATVYYEKLTYFRAGLCSLKEFGVLLSYPANYACLYPGSRVYPVVEMSRKAVFFNGGTYTDPDNRDNFYISYYPYGCIVVMALDLTLRSRFSGTGLDDYMRVLWNRYGKTQKPYTNEVLREELFRLTNDRNFADTFFSDHVYGKTMPDLKTLLSFGGFAMQKQFPNRASPGRNWIFKNEGGKAIIDSQTLNNEPYYRAGLDKGDIILRFDNKPVKSHNDIFKLCKSHKPGDRIPVIALRPNGTTANTILTLEEDMAIEVVPFEDEKIPVNEKILQFREGWLHPAR
ncbi:MAG: M61 family metallopeptidase [Spirochaetales bacterium]|nr:M61 family metallopeptidase [Spirochaetales bacterium]